MAGERRIERAEIQELLLDMLGRFADYCERHDLRYYLVGGTLLGAVRHKGFIPWDDDIDVGMPRADYEKFLALVRKEPVAPEYQVISSEEGNFTLPFAEMLHTATRLERPSSSYINPKYQVLHLVLDIFPQDGWPETEAEAKAVVRRAARLRQMNKLARAKIGTGKTLGKAIAKIPLSLVMKVVGCNRINRRLDRFARTYDYDTSKYVGAITYGIYGLGERCRREEVFELASVEFEGRTYPAPGCWDSYLTGIFGDYMTLPPEEQRHSHDFHAWIKNE